MAAPTWSVGQVLASADVNTWFVPIAANKTADQSVTSSTTLVNDSALAITIAASAYYQVNMFVEYEGGTTGSSDLKFTWTLPNVASFRYMCVRDNTTGGVATNLECQGSDTVIAGTNGSTRNGLLIQGSIWGANASGVVQFRWAQNTSNATPTIVHVGSYIAAWRVA